MVVTLWLSTKAKKVMKTELDLSDQNTIKEIRRKLIGRRAHLQTISDSYYSHINKCAVIKGTHKDDWFDVERLNNGETKVTVYRIKKGKM